MSTDPATQFLDACRPTFDSTKQKEMVQVFISQHNMRPVALITVHLR
jgi:hypothetical protein